MQLNNFKPEFDDLDMLLLDSILDSNNQEFDNQNIIDMSSTIIFGSPIEIAIDLGREKEILSKKKFKLSGKFSRYLNILAVASLSTILIYSVLTMNNSDRNQGKNSAPALISGTNHDTTQMIEVTEKTGVEAVKPALGKPEISITHDSAKSTTSSTYNLNNSSNPQPSWTPRRKNYDEFDEDYALAIFPVGISKTKLEQGDLKLMGFPAKIYSPNFNIYPTKSKSIGRKPTSKNNLDSSLILLPIYTGKPLAKGLDFLVPVNHIDRNSNRSNLTKNGYIVVNTPNGLKYYYPNNEQDNRVRDFFSLPENQEYLQQFYMSKSEVSNIDYREFMHWVAVYNGFKNYVPRTTTSPDSLKMIYNYSFIHPETITKLLNTNTINIYPNSDCWVNDFPYSYNSPMVDHYLHHPAYNNYPVVGVNYYQALAYLDWLTWIWQTQFDNNNIMLNIEFDLPMEYQTDMAENIELENFGIDLHNEINITNLAITHASDIDLRKELGLFSGKFGEYMHTAPVESQAHSGYYRSKIEVAHTFNHLHDNVSEWQKDDYTAWRKYIDFKLPADSAKSLEAKMKLDLINYFDQTCNSKKGKLVRGANWFDERNIDRKQNLIQGYDSKCFVDPFEQHSTVGFRFIARVSFKDEESRMLKIRTLGHDLPKIDYSSLKNYEKQITGFSLIPNGKLNFKGQEITVNAFFAAQTEVTNLAYALFLNYLIDNKKYEDLQKCLPNDKYWAVKMVNEFTSGQKSLIDPQKTIPFPLDFLEKNNVNLENFNSFAFKPVVGISKEAANLYANWLSSIYNSISFRLPQESEWEYMAHGNLPDSSLYPWSGLWLRDSKGVLLARFLSHSYIMDYKGDQDKATLEFHRENQNPEFTMNFADSTWKYYGPSRVGIFKATSFGLYDLAGNAAEMVNEQGITKGGSWASISYFLRVKEIESWSGKPSDRVGFRVIYTLIP